MEDHKTKLVGDHKIIQTNNEKFYFLCHNYISEVGGNSGSN